MSERSRAEHAEAVDCYRPRSWSADRDCIANMKFSVVDRGHSVWQLMAQAVEIYKNYWREFLGGSGNIAERSKLHISAAGRTHIGDTLRWWERAVGTAKCAWLPPRPRAHVGVERFSEFGHGDVGCGMNLEVAPHRRVITYVG